MKNDSIDPVVLQEHDVQVSELSWQQRLRLGQALWREAKGYPLTEYRGEKRGNHVDAEYAAETMCNFLSPAAMKAARDELDRSVPDRMMIESRMLGNLLSSQPLCFNLFADLAADLDLASEWGRLMWPGRVERITNIGYEYSPGRGDERYLGNKTAFDVFIQYLTPSGGKGFIGIEVRYHEDLKGSQNDVRERALEVAEQSNSFANPTSTDLTSQPLSQFYLDHLLALSMLQVDSDWEDGFFVLLYPAANQACVQASKGYIAQLSSEDTWQALTMEVAIKRMGEVTNDPWVRDFTDRYLDPSRVDQEIA